jgi:thiol-disulfide isomerase/thioredoxin
MSMPKILLHAANTELFHTLSQRNVSMSIPKTLLTITVLGFAFTHVVRAADDSPAKTSPLVGDLVAAIKQNRTIPQLTDKLVQELAKPGPDADKLAREVLGSLDQITPSPAIHKFIGALVEQKKDRLAASLVARLLHAWSFGGQCSQVVMGQLVVQDGKLDPELVLAQMPILEDGYFVDLVQSFDRPLSFRAAGYRDLDVPLDNHRNFLAILDKVVLEPLPDQERATLQGKIVLDGSTDTKSAHVYVSTAMGPLNTLLGGFSPRNRWPKDIEAQIDASGTFRVEGLNPSEISVAANADGYVGQSKTVKLTADHPIDLGELRLMSSDLAVYIGRPAPNKEPLQWEADYATALKRAQAEHKPLMVMMTATWCGPCKMLEKETFSDPWICSILSNFVTVKAYEDKEVENKYGGGVYPTLIFADSSGNAAYKCTGYKPAFNFVQDCANAYEKLSIEQPPAIKTLIDKKIVILKQQKGVE